MTRPGLRPIAKVSSGWTLCVDISHPKALPYFVNRSRVRTALEVSRLPEAKALWRDLDALWELERRTYDGPWRESARFRAIDRAHSDVMIGLQLGRNWDPAQAVRA